VGFEPGAALGAELGPGAGEDGVDGDVPDGCAAVVDGAMEGLLSVEGIEADGLDGGRPVTTGGGDKGVEGSWPATDDGEDVPGRSVRVGMADGGGTGEVFMDVVVASGCSTAAVVGNTVVYCVSVMTTRLGPTLPVKLSSEVTVAAEVGGASVGEAIAVAASVEFCC
jgi:hypothetical protein